MFYPKMLCISLLLLSQVAHSQPPPKQYSITLLATGKVLDGNDNQVYPSDWNGGRYQIWRLERADIMVGGRPTYIIRPTQTDKMLDGNDKQLYVAIYNGGSYQKWKLIPMR